VELSFVEFADFRPCTEWLGGVKRLRIGQPAWKHVGRDVIEQLVGSLD
jgi:hypothetical protein